MDVFVLCPTNTCSVTGAESRRSHKKFKPLRNKNLTKNKSGFTQFLLQQKLREIFLMFSTLLMVICGDINILKRRRKQVKQALGHVFPVLQ